MEVTHNVIAKISQGGEKSRWVKIGVVITKDNRKMAIKFDAIPINWDGWAEIVPIEKEKKNGE